MRFYGIALACVAIFLLSCSGPTTNGLVTLPAENGGSHQRITLDTSADADIPYGTWLYKPGNWEATTVGYPLLVFLHGSGEKGNSSTDPAVLDKVLVNGPPKMISNGSWDPPVPMFVLSPQCHDSWWRRGWPGQRDSGHTCMGFPWNIRHNGETRAISKSRKSRKFPESISAGGTHAVFRSGTRLMDQDIYTWMLSHRAP